VIFVNEFADDCRLLKYYYYYDDHDDDKRLWTVRFGWVFFFRFQKTTTTNCLRCVTVIYDVLLTIPAHAPTVINETNRRGNDHLLPQNRCLNFDTRGSLKLRQRRRRPVDISICTKFLCSYAMYWHSTQNTLYAILWYLYECNTYRHINKRSIVVARLCPKKKWTNMKHRRGVSLCGVIQQRHGICRLWIEYSAWYYIYF